MSLKDRYKQTEVGVIPESWKVVKLKDLGVFSTSSVDKKTIPEEKIVNLVNYMDVYTNLHKEINLDIDFMQVSANENQLISSAVLKGDVLFTPSSETTYDIGLSAVVTEDLKDTVHSYHLIKLRFNQDINLKYKRYMFNSPLVLNQFTKLAHGTTRFTLKIGSFEKAILPLPPFEEQKKIAEILSTVDQNIFSVDNQIKETESLKKGLMQKLLTEGIGHTKFKDSELGKIPFEWKIELLDLLSKRGSGHTPNKKISSYWNGGIKWISLADSSKMDNRYIYNTDKEISLEGVKNSSAVLHPKETVVLVRDAGVGKSGILGLDMAVSQHFMAWVCGELLDNIFLYYWLQRNKPIFESIAIGSTIKTIGLGYFKKLKIPLPPLEEQKQIAEILSTADEKLETLREKKESFEELKKGLMQKLLTGEVRVSHG